nr:MAG TPA: hypothetical protein [Caudoviricetes sp.]
MQLLSVWQKRLNTKGIHVTFRPRKKRFIALQKVLFSFFS